MNRLILTMVIIVIIVFLIYPSVGFSYYYIYLKNGRGFQTYQYWEEGEQIRFYIYDGTMGVPKDSVKEIKGTYTGMIFDQKPKIKEGIGSKKKSMEGEDFGKKDSPTGLGEDSQKTKLQEEMRRLQKESTEAWEEYAKIAKQEDGSKAERAEARKRAFEIDIKIQELTRKLKERGQQKP